jgi:putative DNA primase/helicase
MFFIAPYRPVTTRNLALHFHPEHLADLRASGLSDETIKAAGAYSLAPRYISRFFAAYKGVPDEIESALCFPYQGSDFARIKLFPALGKMKYSQPPGTGARLYMPFRMSAGCLYVVEGEKKTLAAHQAGLNAVGIGGVWNWLHDGEPVADLKLVEWDGRDVTIVPDSDVFGRTDLLRPIYALGRELQTLGANVLVAQIPQPAGPKVGLDDYLVARGAVGVLEVFSLSHRIFKSIEYWHGRWKFSNALKATLAP